MIASGYCARVDLLQGAQRLQPFAPEVIGHGTSDMYRELVVPPIKHPECRATSGLSDPMVTIFTH